MVCRVNVWYYIYKEIDMRLAIGIVIGFILKLGISEYQLYEEFRLATDAVNLGYNWSPNKGLSINDYINNNRLKLLDYLNYTPNFWACEFTFEYDRCPFPSLIRELKPVDQRPNPYKDL